LLQDHISGDIPRILTTMLLMRKRKSCYLKSSYNPREKITPSVTAADSSKFTH